MKKILVLTISSAFFMSGLFAYGGFGQGRGMGYRQNGQPRQGMNGGGNLFMMKSELNLTDNQVNKMLKIRSKYRKQSLDIREKLSPMHIKVRKELLEDSINLKKVRALLDEIAKYQTDMRMLRIKHRVEVEKLLTKTQREKYKLFVNNRGRRGFGQPGFRGRRGRGRGLRPVGFGR